MRYCFIITSRVEQLTERTSGNCPEHDVTGVIFDVFVKIETGIMTFTL